MFENKNYLFKFWDTAGQEKFSAPTRSYYSVAHAIIITTAINNRDSFINLKKWLKAIKDKNNNKHLQLLLIGTKCDLIEERVVKSEELKLQAEQLGCNFYETSAKENIGIDEAFGSIMQKVYNTVYTNTLSSEEIPDPDKIIKLGGGGVVTDKKKGCC